MKKIFILTPLVIIPLVLSCQEKPEQASEPAVTAEDKQDMLDRGARVSTDLLTSLGSKLKAALQSGGPEHALHVCNEVAQPSTGEVSNRHEGLTISRVTLKPRNMKNAPDALDQEVLAAWEKQIADGGTLPDDELRYKEDQTAVFYRPIVMQDICMKCHGDPSTFSAGLTEKLASAYPGDKATGYEVGQLRGVFRVEFTSD